MNITEKIALVTGAREGIGRAIALQLADKGARVIAISRDIKDGEFNRHNITEKQCDITSLSQIGSLFEWLDNTFGGLDILINNAGIWQKVNQLDAIPPEVIEKVIATDLTGTIMLTRAALPFLRRSAAAAIINVVSKSGVVAQEGQSVYTAAKYGLRGFTEVLRVDLRATNIHIMAVYQSGTDTNMFRKAGDDFPTNSFTDPTDLANSIVSNLAGPDKFWVKELHVDRA